jgi:leucyl aminopeptidase
VSTLAALEPSPRALVEADLIAIGFTKNETLFEFPVFATLIKNLETTFDISLSEELNFFGASGKAGELFEFPISSKGFAADRIYLVGLGDQSESALRIAGSTLGRKVRGKAVLLASICVETKSKLRPFSISLGLGTYQWHQKTGADMEIPALSIVTTEVALLEEATTIESAITYARDLIHTPSNIKNPKWLADEASKIAEEKNLQIEVFAGKDLKEFGGLRAVGGSSPKPGPRFVKISYQPKGRKRSSGLLPHVVVVGKGITFDTGGVSLKRPYETMTAMKSDMAGAAAALATISALPALQPQVRVTVLMALAENALSGSAQRPSDVISHYGGTSVEVINTDAEGRLVLADALAYADLNLDSDYLLDIATLTGAATLGLGRQYAAMYTRDDQLAEDLHAIGEINGDRVWRMPLIDDYSDALESDIADLNHTADKGDYSAGSVTAALFLEKFVGRRNWVHLDIAGPARSESDTGENPKGGTGFGVRLLIDWITSLS